MPTDEPILFNKVAQEQLIPRMLPGAKYVRAGIHLMDLSPKESHNYLPIFQQAYEGRRVGETLDEIQRKLGHTSIGVGFGGFKNPPSWNMKRELLSKRATTEWDELVTVGD